jgi:hypothetical protein
MILTCKKLISADDLKDYNEINCIKDCLFFKVISICCTVLYNKGILYVLDKTIFSSIVGKL